MTGSQPQEQKTHHISAELRAETMAYALQSGFYNLAANFVEPYVGYRVQRYFARHNTQNTTALHGTYTQNLAGEFVGDIVGASSLMMAEALVPEQLHGASRQIRAFLDPFYERIAHQALGEKRNEPDYERQVDDWKVFQERNLIRSAFVAATGMAGNIAAQKTFLGNPSPTGVIFQGKLASTAITTAIGLTMRMMFPNQTSKVDSWIGKKMFEPLLEDKQIETVGH